MISRKNCKEALERYTRPDDPRFDVSDFVCLFENILNNLNKVFLKKHCILQKILLAARILVRQVSHGLKYGVFCHRQGK